MIVVGCVFGSGSIYGLLCWDVVVAVAAVAVAVVAVAVARAVAVAVAGAAVAAAAAGGVVVVVDDSVNSLMPSIMSRKAQQYLGRNKPMQHPRNRAGSCGGMGLV